MSICPRCESIKIKCMVKAPKKNTWKVMICETCCYSWRNTESPAQTSRDKYPQGFTLTLEQISTMIVSPPIAKK
ncbi:non-oxidative hydroxyarylic acid decarboxylases subunit D [Photobacterium profundum]|uniref:non-oxidative hydroxyarylic acid decarboxylases subunit D n=1 Tax=Photobacterium profundum TaxID=74109 RepID=UPI003D150AD4